MTTVRRLLALTSLALALALGACGGDDEGSDTDQVTAAIEDSYAAFAEGDAEAFCDTLSPDYLADFKDYWGGCDTETLESVGGEVGGEDTAALESPEISDVDIEGDTAQTTVNGEDLEVVNVDGEWKLDDFDVPGSE